MKYVVLLVVGLRARLATSNCAAEPAGWNRSSRERKEGEPPWHQGHVVALKLIIMDLIPRLPYSTILDLFVLGTMAANVLVGVECFIVGDERVFGLPQVRRNYQK